MKFIRRKTKSDYTQDQEITVTIAGTDYPVNITGLGVAPDKAIEVELEDGSIIVLLGYQRK